MSEKENTLATKYDPKEVEDKWYKYWGSAITGVTRSSF